MYSIRKTLGVLMAAVMLIAACAIAPASHAAPVSAPPALSAAVLDDVVLPVATVSPISAEVLALGSLLTVGAFFAYRFRAQLRIGRRLIAVNTLPGNVGSSVRSRRYKASAAMATRYVFVKAGADDEHFAAIAAASDKPIGVITDEAAAAEDPVNVELPSTERTLPLVAKVAINTLNSDLYLTADGKVGLKPTAAGTYWKVGRNLTLATAENDPVECELCEPEKLTIIAALGSTNGTVAAAAPAALTSVQEATVDGSDAGTTQALANSLKAKYNALQVDVAAIHTKYTAAITELEKATDDLRAIAAAQAAAAHGVALATS